MVTCRVPTYSKTVLYFPSSTTYIPRVMTGDVAFDRSRVAIALPYNGREIVFNVGLAPRWEYDDWIGHLYWGDHTENSVDHFNFDGELNVDLSLGLPEGVIVGHAWFTPSASSPVPPDIFPIVRVPQSTTNRIVVPAGFSYESDPIWGSILRVDLRIVRNAGFSTYVNIKTPRVSPWSSTQEELVCLDVRNEVLYTGVPAPQHDEDWSDVVLTDDYARQHHSGIAVIGSTYVPSYSGVTYDPDKLNKAYFQNLLLQIAERVEQCVIRRADQDIFSDLVTEAFNNVQMCKSHGVNAVAKAIATKSSVEGLVDQVGGILKKEHIDRAKLIQRTREIANLRLSIKWGLPLLINNWREIAAALTDYIIDVYPHLKDNDWKTVHSRSVEQVTFKGVLSDLDGRLASCLKVIYKTNKRSLEYPMLKVFDDFGVGSLTDFWDATPWSFVIDWFANVEGVLDATDMLKYRVAWFDLRGSVRSTTLMLELDSKTLKRLGVPCSGHLSCKFYHRRATKQVPLPSRGFSYDGLSTTNIVDGITLVQQKL